MTGCHQSVLAQTFHRPVQSPFPSGQDAPRVRSQFVQGDQQLAPDSQTEMILADRDQIDDPPKDLLHFQDFRVVHVQLDEPRVESLQQGQAMRKRFDQQVHGNVRQSRPQGIVWQFHEKSGCFSVLSSLVQSKEPVLHKDVVFRDRVQARSLLSDM